jgi:hypothetical protein
MTTCIISVIVLHNYMFLPLQYSSSYVFKHKQMNILVLVIYRVIIKSVLKFHPIRKASHDRAILSLS